LAKISQQSGTTKTIFAQILHLIGTMCAKVWNLDPIWEKWALNN